MNLRPVRTYNTACVYFHKFRLVHSDRDFAIHVRLCINPSSLHSFSSLDQDAAAASLFTACKIEDTLKKSKEILCASYNLKLPVSEQLSPDDPVSGAFIFAIHTTISACKELNGYSSSTITQKRL